MSADQTPPPPPLSLSYANPQGATAPTTPSPSNSTSQCEEEDSPLAKKEHEIVALPRVDAAGRGMSMLAEAEEERHEGGRRSKGLRLSRPAEMNPDHGPDKQLQQEQDGSTVLGLNPPALATIEEGVQLSSGAAGPTPRMLRIFIMASITWSAAITSCLGPYFPLYVKEKFNASSMLIGIIFSITSIVQFITCPMVSLLSRRFSRLATLQAGLLMLALGALFFGLLDSIPGFVFGRLLQGIGNGFLEVSGLSLLMRFSVDLRRDIGLLEGASSVGCLLGPLIGGFLSARMGFELLFVLMALPVVALVVLLWAQPHLILPPEESSSGPTWEGSDEGEGEWEELGKEEEAAEKARAAAAKTASEAEAVVFVAGVAISAPSVAEDGTLRRPRRQQTLRLPPSPRALPPPPSPYQSFASSTRELFRALAASPTLPLYIAIVLVVAGGLSFMDTALAEHLVRTAGVSNYTAGLLFTLQVDVYVVFAFFAATLAHKMGEWRTIVGATALWSIAMLALGPLPPLAPSLASVEAGAQAGGLGLSVATLVVLGITETFVFLPFIPLFHRRLRRTLGWAALETEDTVASVWTTTWACGQCLGPLIGGFLLEALPSTTAFACLAGISHASEEATDGLADDLKDSAACQSAFPWVVAAWGITGLVLAFLLVLALLRERLRRVWRRRATKGLPVYSPDAALGELPLPGAAGHEDDYYYADGEQEAEEAERRREGGERGALASIGASMPRRPLLSMSSFYATEEYELDRSRRSVDQSRRSELDRSRRSELDRSRRSELDRSRRSDDLDASLRGGGDFGHFVVEAGELDRSRRSKNGGWEEGKA